MAPSTTAVLATALLALAPAVTLANPHPQGNGYTVINTDGSTQVILPTTTVLGPGLPPPLVTVPVGAPPPPSTGGTIDEGTMIVTLPVESYGTPFNPVLPSSPGLSDTVSGSIPPVPLPSPLPTTGSGSGLPGLSSSGGGMPLPTPSGSGSSTISGGGGQSTSGSGSGGATSTPAPTAAPAAAAPARVYGAVGAGGVVAGIVGLLML